MNDIHRSASIVTSFHHGTIMEQHYENVNLAPNDQDSLYDPGLLTWQLQEWNDLEEIYESNPEFVIDSSEMARDMDIFQDECDAKENRLRVQASSPISGGEFLIPRIGLNTWKWGEENDTVGWEERATERALTFLAQPRLREALEEIMQLDTEVREAAEEVADQSTRNNPHRGRQDVRKITPLHMEGAMSVFVGTVNFPEERFQNQRTGNPHLDAQNRIVVDAKIIKLGQKYHTAESPLGKVYVGIKFTHHIPGVGESVSMIVRLKEADRACPWACVKVLH